ncbi:MAG: helix-turn-helix transcriptional regulator [Thaumarchaeota archaeon]|nr:helix-turn-helix transcriptional regulator [Nitrososphaerota archaeon]
MQEEKFLKSLDSYDNLKACPIALGFRMLGKRWTIEVIRELFLGKTKFNELQKNVPGVNPRMLALRLKELEDIGLIKRDVFPGTPVKIDYSLTNLGRDVIPVMYAMAEFSMKNFPEEVFDDAESRSLEQVYREVRSK